MIIEKIVVRSFGILKDMTLEFSDTVNVIEGQNEAGKSTVAAFIKYMLYGFDISESENAVSERRKRISWDTGMAQGSMYIRAKGKRYLINRSTVMVSDTPRPTYRDEASIVDLETGSPAFGKLSAGEVFFGVDRELFDNTAFIGQIKDSGIDEGSVRESIENILFSGNEKLNNRRAAQRISEKMETLLHKSGKGGAIYDLAGKRDELEERFHASSEDNKKILSKETELYSLKQMRAEAEERRVRFHEMDSCHRNVMLIQTFDKLHEHEEDLDKKNEVYSTFIAENTTDGGFVPDEQYLTDIKVARRGVNDAYQTLSDAESVYREERSAVGITRELEGLIELSDDMGGEDKVASRADSAFGGIIRWLSLGIVGLLGIIAAIVFEIVAMGSGMDTATKIVGGIGGVLMVALAVISGFLLFTDCGKLNVLKNAFSAHDYKELKGKLEHISSARNKRDSMTRSTENAEAAVKSAAERYDRAKAELTDVILRIGEEPPVSQLNEFLDKLEARVSSFLEKKKLLLEEKTNAEITVREIRRSLQDKSEIDIRAQVSPLKRKALSGVDHEEIVSGIEDCNRTIKEQDDRALAVENELYSLKLRAGDPGEYYVKMWAVESRMKSLADKHKAYFLALDAIEHAEENLRAEISPRLGAYATQLMEIMTDKKYTGLDVTDALAVEFSTASGDKRSVDFLSGGTRDLIYVSLRAALIDMLYTEKPPICFDESFAHQDNVRARSLMRALAHLAEEGCQSFVFTCRGRESTLATELIDKPGVFKLSVIGED